MKEQYVKEYKKLLEIGKKKGKLLEEDIFIRFLKDEKTTKSGIEEVIAELKKNGIKIIPEEKQEDLEREALEALINQVSVDDPVKM